MNPFMEIGGAKSSKKCIDPRLLSATIEDISR
jgi:hypothetical protein